MTALLNKFQTLYADFSSTSLVQLPEVYAESVCFTDPVVTLQGREALNQYLARNLEGLLECRFEVWRVIAARRDASVSWVMHWRHVRLGGGAPMSLHGVSDLQCAEGGEMTQGEARIVWQRDYYDLGAMVYEQLPLLGAVLRRIKRRLAD